MKDFIIFVIIITSPKGCAINLFGIGTKPLTNDTVLTSGKFLVSFEVPGPLPGTTEGFCEEMIVVYRTEELNPYLRYPKQEINPWDKHSTYIRLKLREILKVNLRDITIIDIISLP